jgi:hypothetical protein
MSISDKQLTEYIKNRSLVCVRREKIDSQSLQAFILNYSESLILMQYICDFRLDGHLILRGDDISSITCRATDEFQRKLMDENGLIENIDFDFNVELSSFSSLLNALPRQSIVIIEDEGMDLFWIGRFIDSDNNNICLHEFSGAANWDDELTYIGQKDITCCQLNSNYISYYARYFDAYPPPLIPVQSRRYD